MKINATTALPAAVLVLSLAYVAEAAVQQEKIRHMPP
jgi:hypothetical protein